MTPATRTVGRIAIAIAIETVVILAFGAGHIGPLFTGLCTVASIAFAWPVLAHQLGRFNTALLLTLVYVFAAGPMWLLKSFPKAARTGSLWTPKPPPDPAIPEKRRMQWQF